MADNLHQQVAVFVQNSESGTLQDIEYKNFGISLLAASP